jgi:hypothetical protein
MKYGGYLLLTFVTLVSSVLIENINLFSSVFFTIAYVVMGVVVVIGAKYRESYRIDTLLGLLLLYAVSFFSTETLIYMFTSKLSQITLFKLEVIVALDYSAIGFLKRARDLRRWRRFEKIIRAISSVSTLKLR